MLPKSRLRRVLQPALMVIMVLGAITIVAATLRGRPKIEPPERVSASYRDQDFPKSLAIANSQLAELAFDSKMDVAPRADNLAIARRISLALVGSGLSLEEIRALSLVEKENQIRWWTSYLLEDRRWADYFAERFSRAYVGTDQGPFILFRRRKFRMWLAEELRENRPYDEIVQSILSSEGLWTDTPQVNFITATIAEGGRPDPVRLAGRTSRAFLAQRIDCLQCHDDFLGELNFGTVDEPVDGMQEHFHGLAAFFAGTAIPKAPFQGLREDGTPYLVEFLGDLKPSEVEPEIPFAQELLPREGKPRERLASWVTHPDNRAFARATVNRVWALMFSRPLVAPVDSIPLDAVPPIMDTLADDFSANGFDLKRLVRLIIETDAFQRSSRAEFEITEEHEKCWAAFPLTQLRPEQVAGSIFQASTLTAIDESSAFATQLKSFFELQDFLKRFGDRGEDEFADDAVTISQRLVMMNGNITQARTKNDFINNASSRIASLVSNDQEAIKLIYLCTLNRDPSPTELETYSAYLVGKKGNSRSHAIGDVCWAIINSTEFSWNH